MHVITKYFLDVAVYVEHIQDLPSASHPLPFDTIHVNIGEHYNDVTHQLTLPHQGIYFIRCENIVIRTFTFNQKSNVCSLRNFADIL